MFFSSRQLSGSDEELGHVERGKVLLFRNGLPSGKHTKNYGKSQIFNGTPHYKWPFSIAMLVYQRVGMVNIPPIKMLMTVGW